MTTLLQRSLRSFASTLGGQFATESPGQLLRIIHQAAFLLHKATETMLKGIIQAVLGYRIQMHNISRLLRLTRLFTDQLIGLFDLASKAGRDKFAFLKSAYAQAHYSDSFNPDKETLLALLSKVEKLNREAQLVYHSFTQLLASC